MYFLQKLAIVHKSTRSFFLEIGEHANVREIGTITNQRDFVIYKNDLKNKKQLLKVPLI